MYKVILYHLVMSLKFTLKSEMYFKPFELDPYKYYFATELLLIATFKITKTEIKLLAYRDMLLKVEKDIEGGICRSVNTYADAN